MARSDSTSDKGSTKKASSPKHGFGSLGQYRIVVDELKYLKPHRLEDEAYEKLLAVRFELPFQLPWPPNPHSTLMADTFITFRFRPERRAIESHFGFSTKYTVTGVTAATPAIRLPELDQNTMSDTFDWILDHLNHFLVAYALVTKDGDVGPVTLPMLGPFAEWGFIQPYEQTASVEGLFLINPRSVLYEKPVPPQHIANEVSKFKFALATQGYPFLTSWQLRIEGEQHLWEGRYHVAAILLASAFEARANELLRYLFWKAGRPEDEFNTVLQQKPFVRRLRSEFHPHLGGSFDTRKTGPIGDWHRLTHTLRNRVVHGGYRPTREETNEARTAMAAAWDYLMALVRARSSDFPELAPYLELRGDQFLWPPRQ
ncbi:MAG: hypothetical protein Q8Q00_08465 [Dehalococcoidia bacterium]|nr:hypothetical protein [Dehalococcoidia bacterium]